MESINQLAPFQFKNFVFTESFEALTLKDVGSHTRYTRKAIGDAWEAKHPQKYIDWLILKHPDIDEGIPFYINDTRESQLTASCDPKSHVTVTCDPSKSHLTARCDPNSVNSPRSTKSLVKTHDAFDIYKMAIYSELPRAREFLKAFPEFLCAVCHGLIQSPPPDIYQIAQIPNWTHGKVKLLEQIAQERGKSVASIRRMMDRVRKGEPLEKPRPKFIQFHLREKYEQAIEMKKENPSLRGYEIAQKIGACKASVYLWLKKERKAA